MLQAIKIWFDAKIEQGEFEKCAIASISKSCCPNVTSEVIDFDKVAQWYADHYKTHRLASADALYFGTHAVCFVEMKSWRNFFIHRSASIEEQAALFNFNSKLRDSLHILESISKMKEVYPSVPTKQMIQNFHDYPKHFILLTDIDSQIQDQPLNYLSAALYMLSVSSNPIEIKNENEIAEEHTDLALKAIGYEGYSYTNLQPPIRKSCYNMDGYLESL